MMTENAQTIQTKNSFFFSHDSNARNDEKIIHLRVKYGAEGYGIYFMLIEMLMESSEYMLSTCYTSLAFALHVKEELVKSVIKDFDLFEFTEDLEFFYSKSLINRTKPLEKLREQRRQAGQRSAEIRRKNAEMKRLNEQERTLIINHLLQKEEAKQNSQSKPFTIPKLEQIEQYCKSRGNKVNAPKFYDFYQSKGWMIGKNKMKDWKAAVRTWEANPQKTEINKASNIIIHNNKKSYEQF